MILNLNFQQVFFWLFIYCASLILAKAFKLHLDSIDALGEVLQVVPILAVFLLVLVPIKLLLLDHKERSFLRLCQFFLPLSAFLVCLTPRFYYLVKILLALLSNDYILCFYDLTFT